MDVPPLMPVTIVRVFKIQIKTKQCNIFNRLLHSNRLYCILLMLHFQIFSHISVIQFIHFVTVLPFLYIPNVVTPCYTLLHTFI